MNMLGKLWPEDGSGESPRGMKLSRFEGLAFTGAYLFALALALSVLVSSKHEMRSLLAWAVFAVFAACLTGIFILYRKARRDGAAKRHWPLRAENDNGMCDG